MPRRAFSILAFGLLAVTSLAPQIRAQDFNRYYHYPYYYFPHNYAPNYERWPDPKKPFQRPPAWMAYPPYLDPAYRYELWRPNRYHKGFHFWLDQF